MTLRDVVARWQARRGEWERLGVHVEGSKLAAEVVADLESIREAGENEELTLSQAAREIDVHPDSIGRAIRKGRLVNRGRKNAPRVRRSDLVIFTECERSTGERQRSIASLGGIARDAIASKLPRVERG
jgi:hypothetical protein